MWPLATKTWAGCVPVEPRISRREADQLDGPSFFH
jgi:hypothetical protein